MALVLKLHQISSIPLARTPQTLLNNPQFQALQLKSTRKNPNNGLRSGEKHTARDRSFAARVAVDGSNRNLTVGYHGVGGGGGGGEDPVKHGGGGGGDGDADERFNLRWLSDPDRGYMGPVGGTVRWVCVQVTWNLFSAMKETFLGLCWTISASGQVISTVAATLICLCLSLCAGLYLYLWF